LAAKNADILNTFSAMGMLSVNTSQKRYYTPQGLVSTSYAYSSFNALQAVQEHFC